MSNPSSRYFGGGHLSEAAAAAMGPGVTNRTSSNDALDTQSEIHSMMYSEGTSLRGENIEQEGHNSTRSSFTEILKAMDEAEATGEAVVQGGGGTVSGATCHPLSSHALTMDTASSRLSRGTETAAVATQLLEGSRGAPPQRAEAPASPVPAETASIGTSDGSASAAIPTSQSQIMTEEETFYSAPENKHGDDSVWGLLSGVGGNIYEWYDFAVYGLLASEIGANFFPKSSKEVQLINSFGVCLAAFLMRPMGAILFGELGDRIVGRKNALIVSIILITVPSVAMGLLPTYEIWGPIAPILLVILRMLQGLSVGGQLAGSYVLSVEQSTSYNRGLRGSICDASSAGGFLLASAVTTLLRKTLSEEIVNDWGWRIPFWFSLLLAPLLYHVVSQTEESKFWAERSEQKEAEQIIRENEETKSPAIIDIFTSPFRRRQLAGMIGALSATSSAFYILFLWTPVYLSNLRGVVNEANADLMNCLVVFLYILFLLVMGRLSDMFPHRMDLIRIGLPGLIVGCPTMFGMFESESYAGYFLAQLQMCFCLAMTHGPMAAWVVELWMADPSLSFTGVAIGYNVASSLFGGTMPLVATFLYYRSEELANGDEDALFPRLLPGLYVSFLGVVALWCISSVIRHPHDVRSGEKKLREAYEMERKNKHKKKKKRKTRQEGKQRNDFKGMDGYWTHPSAQLVIGGPLSQQPPPEPGVPTHIGIGYVPPRQ